MLERVKQITLFAAGFIAAAAIFAGANSALAASVLSAIYVDLAPIKIFIDGQEKTPPGDMKPFIYDGRTYVALRYAGEAFGKQVEWDGQTRTIVITDPKPLSAEFSESFTNTTRISDNWIKTGGNTWLIDGPNGLRINGQGYAERGNIALTGFLPEAMCNYTVEFEAAVMGGTTDTIPAVYLGRDNDGNFTDRFVFENYNYRNIYYSSKVSIARVSSDDNDYMNEKVGNFDKFEAGRYMPVKIQVLNGQADIYLNGKNVVQKKLTVNKSAFVLASFNNYLNGTKCYVRNFRITLN